MEGNSAIPAAVQAESVENKGILWGKSLDEAKTSGINLTGDNLDIKLLFGDLEGSALLEQIFKFWGDSECDVPWFYDSSNSGSGQGQSQQQLRTDKPGKQPHVYVYANMYI